MPTVSVVNSITATTDALNAPPTADIPGPPSALATERDAYASETGVSLRLLASLPANLGQNLDRAV